MAIITKTLKASGGDYSSMVTWESTEQTDLVTDGDTHVLDCYNDWPSGLTTSVYINGWTTDATHFITIKAADGEGHGGIPEAGFWITHSGFGSTIFGCFEEYTVVQDLEFIHQSADKGLCIESFGSDITYNKILAKGLGVTLNCEGISLYNTTVMSNTVFYQGASNVVGIYVNTAGTEQVTLYNCGAANSKTGIMTFGDSGYEVIMQNCFSYNNTTNWTVEDDTNCSHNATSSGSDDAPGGNSVINLASGDFNNASGGDFHLADTDSILYHAGTNVSLSTDVDGDSYHATTPSIGFDEIVVAGATGSGTLQADIATTVSTGTRVITGSGTLQTSTASTVGAGIRNIVGAAVMAASLAVAAGVGEVAHTGSGTLQANTAATVGIGKVVHTGSGTLQANTATTTGAGIKESVGSGTPQADTAVTVGAGTVSGASIGSGTPQADTATTIGAGVKESIGSGTPQAETATTVGFGIRESVGSGTPQADTATAAGVGTVSGAITGSGSPQAETATTVGSGIKGSVGSGAPQASTATTIGAGVREITGSGTPQASAAGLIGVGIRESVGSGTPQADTAVIAGAGVKESVGSGTLQSNTATLSGVGIRESVGTGDLQADTATITGVGSAGEIGAPEIISITVYIQRVQSITASIQRVFEFDLER